jgi:hypothetical protein
MKKFLVGGAVILAGVTSAVMSTFTPGEETGQYNLLYVVDPGDKVEISAGMVLTARSNLEQDFSSIEKGEAPVADIWFTVRTEAITEAEANSINANCRCLKVNDLDNPSGLETIQ